MTVWLDRAGKHGEHEDLAINENIAVVGDKVPDLGPTQTREDIKELLGEVAPDAKPNTIQNWASQLYAFRHRWQKGDLVVLPFRKEPLIAIGEVVGDYQYRPDLPQGANHTVPVKWLATDVPRTRFDQDLLYSLGAFMTVCRISRNNAEERIKAILEGKKQPPTPSESSDSEEDSYSQEIPNLMDNAKDQIRSYINQNFKGHDMERLVNEILRAQGYQTEKVPEGPDGGIDIIGGRGPLGFDPPRLCVQVKSSDTPADVNMVRELQGVLSRFQAEQGLFVSWGGFRGNVEKETRQIFFQIRLWDSDDLMDAIFANYDKLSEDLQAELPLKKIWTLVLPEE